MNTLVVFGLAASAAIGTVIGILFGMCWVEQRMFGSRAQRRSRMVDSAAPQPTIRIKMALRTRRAGFVARSVMRTGVNNSSDAIACHGDVSPASRGK